MHQTSIVQLLRSNSSRAKSCWALTAQEVFEREHNAKSAALKKPAAAKSKPRGMNLQLAGVLPTLSLATPFRPRCGSLPDFGGIHRIGAEG